MAKRTKGKEMWRLKFSFYPDCAEGRTFYCKIYFICQHVMSILWAESKLRCLILLNQNYIVNSFEFEIFIQMCIANSSLQIADYYCW